MGCIWLFSGWRRTLPDSMRTSGVECCKYAANSGTREATSTLRPREMMAKPDLQLLYRDAEADDILLRKSG